MGLTPPVFWANRTYILDKPYQVSSLLSLLSPAHSRYIQQKAVRKRVIKTVRNAQIEHQERLMQNDIHSPKMESRGERGDAEREEQSVYHWIGDTGMALGQSWSDVDLPQEVWGTFAGVLNCSSVDYKCYQASCDTSEHNYLHLAVSVCHTLFPPSPNILSLLTAIGQ